SKDRQKGPGQEIEGRRERIVRASLNGDPRSCPAIQQRWKQRLEDERGAARGPDGELILARLDRRRLEAQALRAQLCSQDARAADSSGGMDSGQMLSQEARLLSPRTDLLDTERLARYK